jgi:hypothetical protein
MSYQDLVAEIENLSLDEQLLLMETLAKLVSRRAAKATTPQNSLERVRGLLKLAPGEPMPTDAELSDDYTDYLLKKYA